MNSHRFTPKFLINLIEGGDAKELNSMNHAFSTSVSPRTDIPSFPKFYMLVSPAYPFFSFMCHALGVLLKESSWI